MRCIFRDCYADVIASLVKAEYIQENSSYSTAYHYCKSYRIHPKRMNVRAPLKYVKEEVNGYFQRKLNRLKSTNLSHERTDNARQHVIDQTHQLMLVPDTEALAYIADQYRLAGNPNPPETYATYFNHCPLKRVGIDRFGNRVHSVITNMPKVLRRCLRFVSSPLVPVREIDIVNSQPYFLSSVTSALIAQFVPDAGKAVAVFAKYETCPNFTKFKDLCRDGEVYEYLQAAYERDHDTLCDGDEKAKRDFTKRLTYGVLFGDYDLKDSMLDTPRKTWMAQVKNDFYKVYKQEFPTVYQLFKEVKGLYMECTVNKAGERKQYANNCLIAQRLESGVMYSHIVQACINNGYTEVVTVHDCVIVREDEYDNIKAIALNEFNALGLNPKFK
ncbi:hypothetical protein H8B13_02175 [Hymenobacter sp. BT188]|uniref:hypothetical protein n=1 Tax=Hymenobacter sp. BT188 TaxID=2763504 RepID=UPI0016516BFD|nr:hypothetical protein [Hymenobacter sp. BT188]MBC6605618.1 hypothetical protein [Hymenobacter sp. BT188]